MYKNTYIFGVVQEAFKSYSCLENKRLLYKKPHLLQSAQVLGNILHSVWELNSQKAEEEELLKCKAVPIQERRKARPWALKQILLF